MGYPGFRFQTGDAVEIDGQLYDILSQNKESTTLRALGASGQLRPVDNDQFWSLFRERNAKGAPRLVVKRGLFGALPEAVATNIERPLDVFPVAWQEEALKRQEFCDLAALVFSASKASRRKKFPKNDAGFLRIGRIFVWLRRRRAAAALGKKPKQMSLEPTVSGRTYREWFRRWTFAGFDIRALLPCHDAKGNVGSRLDGEVVEIVGRWIRERYMTEERPDAKPVYDCAVAEIEEKNAMRPKREKLPVPSYVTFTRCINTWTTPFERCLMREGKKAAEQKFRHVKRAPQPTRPLENVEIDHTRLDILIVDDAGRQAKGDKRKKSTSEVWLSLARCKATRMIFGYHISTERPSWLSVMSLLNMGVRPKVLDGLSQDAHWPVHGVPEILTMDNGPEFHSRAMRAAAGQLRIEMRYMPRGKGHMKGGIERTLGIVSEDFLGFLPGRLFNNPQTRGDYDSEGRAALTLEKLDELFKYYVVNILHNKPMGCLLGRTPLQMWEALTGYGVRMPPNLDDLEDALALPIMRTVTSVGVTFLGLVYQSAELQAIRKRIGHMGKLLMVKVDPSDMGSVIVLDEGDGDTRKGRWISVPCLYPELADGVSIVEWKATVLLARNVVAPGLNVPLSQLRAARKHLAEEARKLGAKPRKVRIEDVNWAHDHADDPLFDVAPDDGVEILDASVRRGRGRPPKNAAPANAIKVGDGGHVPAAPADIDAAMAARTASDADQSPGWADEAQTFGTTAGTEENAATGGDVDFDDTDNWSGCSGAGRRRCPVIPTVSPNFDRKEP